MSYKTILVQLNESQSAERILEPATALARAFGAHLIGLHVQPVYRLAPPVPLPIGSDVIGSIKARLHEETDRIKATFDSMTRGQPFVSEWRFVTADRTDPCAVVQEHGRATDLIIAGAKGPDEAYSVALDFPERLAIESGRPVLVIPRDGHWAMPPTRITVGWNGRREAARAVFDALPFLTRAQNVQVVQVDEGRSNHEAKVPDFAIGAALARHGVKTTLVNARAEPTAGETLRTQAAQNQSDLLVMGAYGHSRLREFAFGGVTRHLLQFTLIPVLFSH